MAASWWDPQRSLQLQCVRPTSNEHNSVPDVADMASATMSNLLRLLEHAPCKLGCAPKLFDIGTRSINTHLHWPVHAKDEER